ncbi:MAG: glycosyltransferase family 2 protein [Planctomycetes bacterium]|nr:glycosyltransferase family 2 protein [Planctomycetota bacterium]
MKLIIQIPCLNERDNLPQTLADLPKAIPGIDVIETLVIDDGSTDGTADLAESLGVNHIIRFTQNRGLAAGFFAGITTALQLGADIVVNTDADNQYRGENVEKLVRPIIDRTADIVIGCRPIKEIPEFSLVKKFLQGLGSSVVSRVAGVKIPDTTSGFRAYSREALFRLQVVSRFSYTLETILQAGIDKIPMTWVDVSVNPKTRSSRLFKNSAHYIWLQMNTIVRTFVSYRPLWTFFWIGLLFEIVAMFFLGRFITTYILTGNSNRHMQSMQLMGAVATIGVLFWLFGFLADIISSNRKMIANNSYMIKQLLAEKVLNSPLIYRSGKIRNPSTGNEHAGNEHAQDSANPESGNSPAGASDGNAGGGSDDVHTPKAHDSF